MMAYLRDTDHPACRGSVLILALWVVFFLAALALATGTHVGSLLRTAERMQARVHARALAAAGAAQAAAVIMGQTTNAWDGVAKQSWNRQERFFKQVELPDGRFFSVVFPGHTERPAEKRFYGVCGEEARINLNLASTNLLMTLFVKVGELGVEDAQRQVAALLTLRGDAPDESLTGGGGSGYSPSIEKQQDSAGAPLRDVEALRRVMDDASYARIRPYVTVHGRGTININASEAVVLQVLGESVASLDASTDAERAVAGLVEKIVRYRDGGKAFEKAEYALIRMALQPLTADEERVLAAMTGQNVNVRKMLDVSSSAFGGTATLDDPESDGGGPVLQVDFVWDVEQRTFVMWRER